ncbi:TlpA disulfide reductase family protein [Marinifilum fragile]|uniref:TlpA family protein disulfide reductase n=1 Tax=Marinifilum fragile TaxID=570161 RepID=UPI002AA916EF|nr:TlpA disulfide reductase family protein [Marinifilum fragile]
MRSILLSITLFIISVNFTNAQKDNFHISINIKNIAQENEVHSVGYYNSVKNKWDRLSVKGENFIFSKYVEEPEVIKFFFENNDVKKNIESGYIPCLSSNLYFIAVPNTKVKAEGEATDCVEVNISGEYENNILNKYINTIRGFSNEIGNLSVKLSDKGISDSMKQSLQDKREVLKVKESNIKVEFLNKYASSVTGLWLLDDLILRRQIDIPTVKKYFKKIDEKYNNVRYYKNLKSRIDSYYNVKIGTEILLVNNDKQYGEIFDLKKYRGNYVIIDFWGTWCRSCIAGFPNLNEFSEKHDITVVAINCGDTKERWEKSKYLEKYCNFVHIRSDKKDFDLVSKFNIQGYPTKLLIGPNGKLLYRCLGEKEDLYTEIESFID